MELAFCVLLFLSFIAAIAKAIYSKDYNQTGSGILGAILLLVALGVGLILVLSGFIVSLTRLLIKQ